MRIKGYSTYIRNLLLPTIVYSGLVGGFIGVIIFFYKWGAGQLTHLSQWLYLYISNNPIFIPLLFIVLVLLAVIMSFIIKWAPQSKGGGIPTSEGILRGLISFNWIKTFLGMIVNSYISFFAGLPLGNEGPSVQIGTAIGRGIRKTFLQPDIAWDRYVMTAGASAGFAVATCAPITGILFALEEAHKRFSPMILSVSVIAVTVAMSIATGLGNLFDVPMKMFAFSSIKPLTLNQSWIAIAVGIFVGLGGVLFSYVYKKIGDFIQDKCANVPKVVSLIVVFILTGICGLLFVDSVGGGHALIEKIMEGDVLWYSLLVLLVIKFFMISFANSAGATGGLFIPMLAVGALFGGLFNCIFVGILPDNVFQSVIVLSICTFLGALLRAPMTAIVFGIETMQGLDNTLYIAIAVIVAYILLELLDIKPLYDITLERNLKQLNKGKTRQIIERTVTVMPKSFVIGKQTRDIFWPPRCLVLEITRNEKMAQASMDNDGEKIIHLYDTIKLRYQTFDDNETYFLIQELVGKQDSNNENII